MDIDVIRIPVDAESAEDQQKIQVLLSVWLRDIGTSDPDSLRSLMDTISDRAQERGLTPELLDQLLN
jgi:hypothetical protein